MELPGQMRLSKFGGGRKRMGKETSKIVKIIQISSRLSNRDPISKDTFLTWKEVFQRL